MSASETLACSAEGLPWADSVEKVGVAVGVKF
jgi:hypothetical protein